jgi:hypothetical protein
MSSKSTRSLREERSCKKSDAKIRLDFTLIAHELVRKETLVLAARVRRLEKTLGLPTATADTMTDFTLEELRDRVAHRMEPRAYARSLQEESTSKDSKTSRKRSRASSTNE